MEKSKNSTLSQLTKMQNEALGIDKDTISIQRETIEIINRIIKILNNILNYITLIIIIIWILIWRVFFWDQLNSLLGYAGQRWEHLNTGYKLLIIGLPFAVIAQITSRFIIKKLQKLLNK